MANRRNQSDGRQTKVMKDKLPEQPQSEHAYCALPDGFYDRLALRKRLEIDRTDNNERTLFSVRTWDGRDVMKIDVVA